MTPVAKGNSQNRQPTKCSQNGGIHSFVENDNFPSVQGAPDARDSAYFFRHFPELGQFPVSDPFFSPAAGNASCELQQHLIQAMFLENRQF
jgi:hypothetical protein